MVLKTLQHALENITKITEETRINIRGYLLNIKLLVIPHGVFLPDDLIAELEDFISRNAIVNIESDRLGKHIEINQCCIRCLKSHALSKGREFGLDSKSLSFLEDLFKCESGHNGYYLDSGNLVKT